MWIKINNQVVNSTLIRHISQIEEASPERFHADKMDKWWVTNLTETSFPLALKWRDMLVRAALYLGTETKTKPHGVDYSRFRVVKRTAVPGEAVKEEFVDDWKRSSYANRMVTPFRSSRSVRAVTLRTTKPQPHATRWLQC